MSPAQPTTHRRRTARGIPVLAALAALLVVALPTRRATAQVPARAPAAARGTVRLVVGPRQERRTLAVRPSAGDSIEVALLRATGSNHAADTIVVHLARADVRTWAPAARAQAAWLVAHHCGDADTEGPPTVRAQPVAASPGAAGGGDAGRLSVGCAASLDEHGRNPVQYTYVEIPHHDRDGPWTKVDLSGPAQMRLVIDALARMAGAGSAAAPAGQPRAGARP